MEKKSKKQTEEKSQGISANPFVSKSFFAVISKETTMERVKTLLLADTKEKAVWLWKRHNDIFDNSPLPRGWKVIVVEAKNVC